MFRAGNFEKLLEKATSNLHLDPDWPTILQICDLIRQDDVQPKVALAAIKKKITNPNPHVAFFGLLVLESCVKNCGNLIHDEIGTKQYMEQLKDIVKNTTHEKIKQKILELIQAWAFAFRNSPKYTAVKDTMNIMKAEGYEFPVLKESDAMFSADTAPKWADGDVCHRCRVAFSLVQRKHHCRACGQVFCRQCSSKQSMLPKFGIEKEVRVCEACYEQVNRPSSVTSKESDLPVEYLSSSLAQQQQVPTRKSAEEVQEEEELELALALSESEAEMKEKQKKRMTSSYKSNITSATRATHSPPLTQGSSPSKIHDEENVDPELARYMNRKYWEQRQITIEEESSSRGDVTSPSAPNIGSPMPQRIMVTKQQNGEVDNNMDEFVSQLRSQVEIFVNRMKSNSSRGRSISNDSFFQNLFMSISTMHSRLLKHIREHDDTRVCYEGLQDKLAQVKDARAALDALREEHRDRLRREAEEAERLKQMQMAQKLDIMRKKKQEYLQYQRELALQKIQERERELQMRQEQQKQQYIMGGYQPVSNYMVPPSQGSPIRHVHYPPPGTNYNPMSPNNQGVYAYGPTSLNNYSMQNYGMSQMNSMPPHMMSNISNPDQPPPQPSGPDPMIQNRDNIGPAPPSVGMMPQIPNIQTIAQAPPTGHQMSIGGPHPSASGHLTAQSASSQVPQGIQGPINVHTGQAVPPGGLPHGQGVSNGHPMPQHIPPTNNPIGPLPSGPSNQQVPGQIPHSNQQTQPIQFQPPPTTTEPIRTQEVIKPPADDITELISFD